MWRGFGPAATQKDKHVLKSITRKENGKDVTVKVAEAKAKKMIAKGWKPVLVKSVAKTEKKPKE